MNPLLKLVPLFIKPAPDRRRRADRALPKAAILFFCLALSLGARAQLSAVGSIGLVRGYKPPYAEAGIEGRHGFGRFHVFGEALGASGRKSDTGDGFHLGLRGVASVSVFNNVELGGGYAWSEQWTSQYTKPAGRPVVYLAWHNATHRLEGFGLFRGSDHRNEQQGGEGRYAEHISRRLSWCVSGQFLRGHQTDRPADGIWIPAAKVWLLVDLFGGRQ